ncbi:zinc knuckle CX2CX4HX4C containing protein [Tanacetum coccineum]
MLRLRDSSNLWSAESTLKDRDLTSRTVLFVMCLTDSKTLDDHGDDTCISTMFTSLKHIVVREHIVQHLTPLPSNTTAPISSTDIVPSSSATGISTSPTLFGSDEIIYFVSDISEFNPASINVVSDFFKVSLLTPVDIDYFLKDLDSDRIESLLSDDNDITSEKPSDPIVQSVDINPTPTSYAGAVGASTIGQSKVNSNFRTLVVEPIFDGLNISIPRKVVEKSQAGLEAVLEGGPWLIRKSPIILKKWSMDTRLLKEELTRIPIWVKLHDVPIHVFEEDGRSSFARCLIKVNSEADLVEVVTIGIPSLTGEDFTKESIRVEYEWRPSRCDTCKIFGHVQDQCPKRVVSPSVSNSHVVIPNSNVVTPTAEKNDEGFQTMVKNKKMKSKPKCNNVIQFTGPSVKHHFRYEPKAAPSAPKKGATSVGDTSPKLKATGISSKEGNVSTSNSYSALENDDEEGEGHIEIVYDESANLFPYSKAGESSSFTAAAG